MESTLATSIMGAIAFTLVMYFAFKYVNGNWNVSESNRELYLEWVETKGSKIKKFLVLISIIYGVAMSIQIYNQILN